MKQLLILTFLLCSFGLFAQRSAVMGATAGTDSTKGAAAASIVLPAELYQEYDYSYQIIPTACGSGDSVNAAVALWQANDFAGTSYTEITSARDTITATTGKLVEGTNAYGIKHKIILTGISTDTVKFKVYWVLKQDRQF